METTCPPATASAATKTVRARLTPRQKPSICAAFGPMAEWLRRGLQILAPEFDSRSGLHSFEIARLFQRFRINPMAVPVSGFARRYPIPAGVLAMWLTPDGEGNAC